MSYSLSQLDAIGDVDPVAEADVYLAYGRDLQAEEILKEALKTNPTRAAIHAKLAEIYAKRRDLVLVLAVAFGVATFGLNYQITMALMARQQFGLGRSQFGNGQQLRD